MKISFRNQISALRNLSLSCGKISLILFSILISNNTYSDTSSDTSSWLMKIHTATMEVSFSGTFVFIHDGEIETMEIARRISGDVLQERIYVLNGEPREVIRNMDKVWCYIPDQSFVVHDYRRDSEIGFARILPHDHARLEQYYEFEKGEELRIADRIAIEIKVLPKDAYRYGYSLWADKETGLLLRSDLIGDNGSIVEQYQFIDISINEEISDEALKPVSNMDDFELLGSDTPLPEPTEPSNWWLENLPDGYELTRHIRRRSPIGNGEVEHLVYTDGLSSVSVFIKKANENQSELTGLSNMSAVHAFRQNVSDHRVTVMGEVPAKMVQFLAQGVRLNTQ